MSTALDPVGHQNGIVCALGPQQQAQDHRMNMNSVSDNFGIESIVRQDHAPEFLAPFDAKVASR